jgi:hypothetical protein
LSGAQMDVGWKRKQCQLEGANDKKDCGMTTLSPKSLVGRQRGGVEGRDATGRPKIARPAQMLIGSLPQLHKCPGHPEFGGDVSVKIPGNLADRFEHVLATDFVLDIPVQSDPYETNKIPCGLGHKAHCAIAETSGDDVCGAGNPLHDTVRRRCLVYPRPGRSGQCCQRTRGNRLHNKKVFEKPAASSRQGVERPIERIEQAVAPSERCHVCANRRIESAHRKSWAIGVAEQNGAVLFTIDFGAGTIKQDVWPSPEAGTHCNLYYHLHICRPTAMDWNSL